MSQRIYPDLPFRASASTVDDVFRWLIESPEVRKMVHHNSLDKFRNVRDAEDAVAEFCSYLHGRYKETPQALVDFFNDGHRFVRYAVNSFANQLMSRKSAFHAKYARSKRNQAPPVELDSPDTHLVVETQPIAFEFSANTRSVFDVTDRDFLHHLLRCDLAQEAIAQKRFGHEDVEIYEQGFLFLIRQSPKAKRPSARLVSEHLGIGEKRAMGAIMRVNRWLKSQLQTPQYDAE